MKKLSFVLLLLVGYCGFVTAQPSVLPTQLPKKEILKPVANIKTYPELNQFLYQDSWKADVWWTTENAGHSSTIPEIRFTLNGQAIWQSPFPEIVSPGPGTFIINGNNLVFNFNYSPYRYSFTGTYDKYTGKITGTFTQSRMKMLNAPKGYTPGTLTGTFSMGKK